MIINWYTVQTEMVQYELFIINQHKHLRNFNAENSFIIGLKSMVFRMSFSMHMSEGQLCCEADSSTDFNVKLCYLR